MSRFYFFSYFFAGANRNQSKRSNLLLDQSAVSKSYFCSI
jgi:hypothetical protein